MSGYLHWTLVLPLLWLAAHGGIALGVWWSMQWDAFADRKNTEGFEQ